MKEAEEENVLGMTKREFTNFQTFLAIILILVLIGKVITTVKGNTQWCRERTYCEECSYNFLKNTCTCCGETFKTGEIQDDQVLLKRQQELLVNIDFESLKKVPVTNVTVNISNIPEIILIREVPIV